MVCAEGAVARSDCGTCGRVRPGFLGGRRVEARSVGVAATQVEQRQLQGVSTPLFPIGQRFRAGTAVAAVSFEGVSTSFSFWLKPPSASPLKRAAGIRLAAPLTSPKGLAYWKRNKPVETGFIIISGGDVALRARAVDATLR